MRNRRPLGPLALALPMLLVVVTLSTPARASNIEGQLEQMLQSHELGEAQVAVMVRDLDTGRTLARLRAEKPMIPASNMKLITTAAALDVLGPEFLFRTELRLIRDNDNAGTTLLVRGDGDPAFGDPVLLEAHGYELDDVLASWEQAVAETDLQTIDRLLVDDRVFDRQFVHPSWPEGQLIRGYSAQVAGLNFYRNCIDVRLIPDERVGLAPDVEIYPDVPFIETTNKATTGGKDSYWISRASDRNKFTFHGTVRNRPYEPTQVTVHDPPMFFGRLFAHRLDARADVTVSTVQRIEDDAMLPVGSTLHRMQTTLPAILDRVNRDSQNMFAEALLKRMGRAVTGTPGSWENGAAAVRLALRQRLGTSSAAIRIADGSGYSRDNRVSAEAFVQLLQSMHDDSDTAKARIFRESLSEAGRHGTLEKRLTDLPHASVHGKSGYLRSVSALSGYLVLNPTDDEPRTIAFSFLFNGFKPPLYNAQMKQLQDDMLRTIVETLEPSVQLGG
ncbi:MAG: D-alanyl-D-alanine carboxypeptidase/D-alanyl-D-alanine-endopeptidase [Phycisphaeraceae bacterium]